MPAKVSQYTTLVVEDVDLSKAHRRHPLLKNLPGGSCSCTRPLHHRPAAGLLTVCHFAPPWKKSQQRTPWWTCSTKHRPPQRNQILAKHLPGSLGEASLSQGCAKSRCCRTPGMPPGSRKFPSPRVKPWHVMTATLVMAGGSGVAGHQTRSQSKAGPFGQQYGWQSPT